MGIQSTSKMLAKLQTKAQTEKSAGFDNEQPDVPVPPKPKPKVDMQHVLTNSLIPSLTNEFTPLD